MFFSIVINAGKCMLYSIVVCSRISSEDFDGVMRWRHKLSNVNAVML